MNKTKEWGLSARLFLVGEQRGDKEATRKAMEKLSEYAATELDLCGTWMISTREFMDKEEP